MDTRTESSTAPTPSALPPVTEKEGAGYLNTSVAYLRKRRRMGLPPVYLKLGKCVRYTIPDLDAHLRESRVEPTRSRSRA